MKLKPHQPESQSGRARQVKFTIYLPGSQLQVFTVTFFDPDQYCSNCLTKKKKKWTPAIDTYLTRKIPSHTNSVLSN